MQKQLMVISANLLTQEGKFFLNFKARLLMKLTVFTDSAESVLS
jgi:hypothetical protein